MASSIGGHVVGLLQPHPDSADPYSFAEGVNKRVASELHPICPKLLRRFRRFVRNWLKRNMVPLGAEVDVSVEAWLDKTNYPKWRKEQLLQEWHRMQDEGLKDWDFFVTLFMKDEFYDGFKYPRNINARKDAAKVFFGPIFKLIEEELFKLPWFVKKIPVDQRPQYIMERIARPGVLYYATDYSAFEAHFVEELMEACEFELYSYMTSKLPGGGLFMYWVTRVLAGWNRCVSKFFTLKIRATRMSGEMCTSLGNGFANLMFMLFMCSEAGVRDLIGVVEGDDGLFSGTGRFPTPADFERLGLNLKMSSFDDIGKASFCGMVFDPSERVAVTNPLKYLATCAWATGKYVHSRQSKKLELLRCKALSLAHAFPGCPILDAYSHYLLRATRGVNAEKFATSSRAINNYWRDAIMKALSQESNLKRTESGPRTRSLVEELYGIPVELQLAIEAELDSMHELKPLNFPTLVDLAPPDWRTYYDRYVFSKMKCEPKPSTDFPGFDYEPGRTLRDRLSRCTWRCPPPVERPIPLRRRFVPCSMGG